MRYEELEPEELFHVIDDLEGAKTRGRIREFIWISIIAHMLVFFYLSYGQRFFPSVRVRDADSIKNHDKDITYLNTPKVAKAKPKLTEPNRAAAPPAKMPQVDRKTLEAMRKAEPTPQPAPPSQAPAPQVAQQQPQPAPQPPPNQQSQLEAPTPAPRPAARPAPTAPSFNMGPSTPGEAIRQAARAAASAPPIFGGSSGGGGGGQPGSAGGAEILSDTMGVDFGPYMKRVVYATERAWWPIIPDIARPPLNKQGKVMVRFKIMKDGSVKNMTLEGPSGDVSLDRAAWGGILGASPFDQLPKEFNGPYLELRFYFLYNIKPGQE